MNVFTNILKILIVLLALGLVGCILMLAVMVLFPGVSLFGIHFISGDNKIVYSYYDVTDSANFAEWSKVDVVVINTDSWNVRVYSVNSTKENRTSNGIDARLSRNYSGFSQNDVTEATISEFTFEEKSGVNYMTISTVEPSGWFSRFDCTLSIYLGENTMQDKKLLITTNSGNVILGEEMTDRNTNLNFKEVEIVANSGTSTVDKVSVTDTLKITKGSGDINVKTPLLCDVQVAIKSGLGNISLNTIGSESVKKSLVIDELHNCGVYFGDIFGDMIVNANTGVVKGDKITGTVVFDGINCKLIVNEVNKNLFFNNKDGSLYVDTANVVIANVTGKGGVKIVNLNGKSVLETANGDVNVESVSANLNVSTINGNITLNNGENKTINYVVESTNGAVSIKNVNGSVRFTTNNNGRASYSGSFEKLVGENVIKTYSGEINIDMLNAGYGFLLKDWSTKSSVYFKLSALEEFSVKNSADDDNYKDGVRIGGYTGTTDTLSISSNAGKLRVVHPDLV